MLFCPSVCYITEHGLLLYDDFSFIDEPPLHAVASSTNTELDGGEDDSVLNSRDQLSPSLVPVDRTDKNNEVHDFRDQLKSMGTSESQSSSFPSSSLCLSVSRRVNRS